MTHPLDSREQDIYEQDIYEQDSRKGCPYISCLDIWMLISSLRVSGK